jgi:hypothetical protein
MKLNPVDFAIYSREGENLSFLFSKKEGLEPSDPGSYTPLCKPVDSQQATCYKLSFCPVFSAPSSGVPAPLIVRPH